MSTSSSNAPHPGAIYLGTSGWAYPAWKPEFYPPKLSSKDFLRHYAARLNSVEINYTFRRLPSRKTVDDWISKVAPNFRFSFKAPQRITHIERLKDSAESLLRFSAALAPVSEAGRMGLILFQLPPYLRADVARLAAFLKDAGNAARMAFEFRHPSWFTEEIYGVLRSHNVALCVAESDDLETPEVATASFSFYRLRKSDYGPHSLERIEKRLRASAERGEVFAYFKHEETSAGARWAEALLERFQAR